MKKILGEIVFDIRRNPIIFTILIFQLTVFFIVCLFSEQLEKQINIKQQESSYEQQEMNYYYLTDNLVGDYETAFFEDSNALGKLKIMYSMLTNHPDFTYLEMYNNPVVLIGENINDRVLDYYEQGKAEYFRTIVNGKVCNEVKCFWVSSNIESVFDLQCQSGKLWSEAEKNNTPIPIVLGSEYMGIYEVGDYIEGISPIASEDGHVKFQVYGILEEGEYLLYRDRIINLDRYVLIPLQDEKTIPANKEELRTQKLLYLFKINGTLYSTLSANELQSIVQEICENSGVIPSSKVSTATNSKSYILNQSMLDILCIFEKMLFMLNVFATVATILYTVIKIDKNKEYYAILTLNGFSLKQISLIVMGTVVIALIMAGLIAGVIYWFIAYVLLYIPDFPVIRILIFNVELILIVGISGYLKIRNLDISLYIGGNE